jgi:hypothetical protein
VENGASKELGQTSRVTAGFLFGRIAGLGHAMGGERNIGGHVEARGQFRRTENRLAPEHIKMRGGFQGDGGFRRERVGLGDHGYNEGVRLKLVFKRNGGDRNLVKNAQAGKKKVCPLAGGQTFLATVPGRSGDVDKRLARRESRGLLLGNREREEAVVDFGLEGGVVETAAKP